VNALNKRICIRSTSDVLLNDGVSELGSDMNKLGEIHKEKDEGKYEKA